MSTARVWTWAAQSGGKCTKNEATVPTLVSLLYMYFILDHKFHPDSNEHLHVQVI